MFISSNEVFEWLEKFINLERGQKPKSFRIDRMQFLSDLAGNPERCAPSIHIAGSKGKGSVTAMSASILTAAGFRAARYMSPHITDIRERITLNDSFFSEEVYCAAGNELRFVTEKLLPKAANPLFNPEFENGCEPTFFELLTLLFFLCAKHGGCDVMVVETGMGGRLDSTNILDPLVSVITLIELEHTNFLGDTIEKVAGEKAGIIKQGKPIIAAKQNTAALEILKNKASEKNSELIYLPEIAKLSDVQIKEDGTDFNLSFKSEKINPQQKSFSLSIPIPGKAQAENAALAITAVKTAFPQISEDALRKGLADLKIPGRFEKITENPAFIIDGAHTPQSLSLCIETFCLLYGEYGVLLFGCAADKDFKKMAEIASPHFSKIIITTPGNFKASNPASVYEAFADFAGKEKTLLEPDTQEAIKKVVAFAGENRSILGTGSFYLVSEIRKNLKKQVNF